MTAEASLQVRLAASSSRPVWLRVGQLVDGGEGPPLRDAHLVYDATTIRFVGNADSPPPREVLASEQQQPDAILPSATALPGLIEAHAHLFLEGAPVAAAVRKAYLEQTPEELLGEARRRFAKILNSGVLAIRDAGDNRGVGLALRSRANRATPGQPLPYLESPGPALHHRGRYGRFMSTPVEDFSDPEDCVARLCHLGAERIKLIATGIINFEKAVVSAPPQMSLDELQGFARAAARRGLKTFAHSTGAEGIERVITAGIHSVEHGYFVTMEQIARMRDANIAWVPTLAPVAVQAERAGELGWSAEVVANLERIVEEHSRKIEFAHRAGGTILAGSDAGSCGVPHGVGLLRELELLERAGLSSLDVLRAATGRSDAMLGLGARQGRLQVGYLSRFLVTNHDPLETVSNLRKEKTVVFDDTVLEVGPVDIEAGL